MDKEEVKYWPDKKPNSAMTTKREEEMSDKELKKKIMKQLVDDLCVGRHILKQVSMNDIIDLADDLIRKGWRKGHE